VQPALFNILNEKPMPKNAQPVAKVIAQALEQRIIEGLHAQTVPLRQAELAAEFGTSHIPVREALATLAEKGLVQIIPNRGAVVVPLSAHQCRELAEMRAALEPLALRRSVPRLTAGMLAAARQAWDQGRRARTLARRAQHNWAFHRALYAGGDQPFLMGQLETLWRHADRYLMFAWTHARYESRSDDEHAALLEACEARDVRRACTLTRRHIEAAAEAVEKLLAQGG
jgi:DNA-binding GntR family transcriptional regulator